MKKKLLVLLSLIVLVVTGCTSNHIRSSKSLKNSTITAKLYIPALPGAEVRCSGIINAQKEIEHNFRNINIKEILINESDKTPPEKQRRVKLIADKKLLSKEAMPLNNNYLNEMKNDPTVSNYKFSTIVDEIGTEYVIVLKIDRILWDGSGYTRGVFISAEGSMHEVKSDKIVWRATLEDRKVIGITDGPAKDIEQLKSGIAQTAALIYEKMYREIYR